MTEQTTTIRDVIHAARDAENIVLYGKFSTCFRARSFLKSIGQANKILCICHDKTEPEKPGEECVLMSLEEISPQAGTLVLVAAEKARLESLVCRLEAGGFSQYIVLTDALVKVIKQYERCYRRLQETTLTEDITICAHASWAQIAQDILGGAFGKNDCPALISPGCADALRTYTEQAPGAKVLCLFDPLSPDSPKSHQEAYSAVAPDLLVDLLSPSEYFYPSVHNELIVARMRSHATIECCMREIYRNKVPGNVAEAGVWRGKTARWINACFPERKLYLFDTFSGFDTGDQEEEDKNGRYRTNTDYGDTSVQIVLNSMPYPGNCLVKKGWFPESAADVDDLFCLVRLDMDLYQPTKAGLEFFYPKMAPGGYILVHDCRSDYYAGAREALVEFCREKGLGYIITEDKLGTAVISIGLAAR